MDKVSRFFGKICNRHPEAMGERRTSNMCCVECVRETKRKSRKANPESNRASARVSNAKWSSNNRGMCNAKLARYKAAKLQATPAWANEFFINEAYQLAKLREKLVGGRWHVDHMVPLQSDIVCGLHTDRNLQVIPGPKNESKCNRYWVDMP